MELKEQIDSNIKDLLNRIDRLTSGNVGHAKNQLRFQIKCVGEFVNEMYDSYQQPDTDNELKEQNMELAIEILKREIAQRELAQKHDHLRKDEVKLELESLNKAVKKLTSCRAK
jgi:hypothetical protein